MRRITKSELRVALLPVVQYLPRWLLGWLLK